MVMVGVMLRKILNPTWAREVSQGDVEGEGRRKGADLGDHLCCFSKVGTPPHCVGLGEVVLYQPQADVVAHLVELLVHLDVVAVEVLT